MYGKLFILTAPSGCGKTTVSNILQNQGHITLSVSTTTREPRDGEEEGKHYYFVSKQRFNQLIEQNDLLEYAKVYENYYGTRKSSLEKIIACGINVLLTIDSKGATQLKKLFPDCISIFMHPASIESLKQRLIAREGGNYTSSVEIRLQAIDSEVADSVNYDYAIINDELQETVDKICAIIKAKTVAE